MCGVVSAATTPHTDVFQLAILTTVTLASTDNALPDDGVTAPKHVGAVLTLRQLMSYIYIYIYIYIYMERPFLMFLDHTQRRTTVGRTPLDE